MAGSYQNRACVPLSARFENTFRGEGENVAGAHFARPVSRSDKYVMPDDVTIENRVNLEFEAAEILANKYVENQRDFFESLTKLLEDAIPTETEAIRTGGMFSKKLVQKVTVAFKEKRYAIEDVGHDCLHAERARVVQGIALKTESISIEIWVDEIVAFITERSRTSISARKALSRIMRREASSRSKAD